MCDPRERASNLAEDRDNWLIDYTGTPDGKKRLRELGFVHEGALFDLAAEIMPWSKLRELGWLIVGMNHYRENNRLHLYVCIKKGNTCHVEQGRDEAMVFRKLLKRVTG